MALQLSSGPLVEDVRPLRLESPDLPNDLESGQALALMADPFTFEQRPFAAGVAPEVTLVGGLASAVSGPGGNHLILDDRRSGWCGRHSAPSTTDVRP
ncbi:MAG: hypothetical protein Ct9H300mP12_15300 [Acidimicrobiales bacterium]|nr:MAG: hypothetical protein Ct9H300mP12_15300 [Acidimicrobiales bacterium]